MATPADGQVGLFGDCSLVLLIGLGGPEICKIAFSLIGAFVVHCLDSIIPIFA